MVDATKAMESEYLTADLVKNSATQKLVILDQGEYQDTDYGEGKVDRLTLKVEIDGKEKLWRPNKDSVKNIVQEMDTPHTEHWIGATCMLSIISVKGKDSVIVKQVIKKPKPQE